MLKRTIGYLRKTRTLLTILLIVFFLKGVAFSAVLPMLQGFDEPNHFPNIQHFSFSRLDPDEFGRETSRQKTDLRKDTQNINFDQVRNTFFNTPNFTEGIKGAGEDEMIENTQDRNYTAFPEKYSFSAFARIMSTVNWLLGSHDLLFRFFFLRIISVLFGVIIVYLAFLLAKSAGFSENASLLFAAILAFQPMLTNVTSIINYDVMLVLAFTLFIYAGINLIRFGFSRKFLFLSILAVVLGIFTKGTGIILFGLFVIVFLYAFQKKYKLSKIKILVMAFSFLAICSVLTYFFSPFSLQKLNLFESKSDFKSFSHSISSYYSETVDSFEKYSLTFWGNFGWINAPISIRLLHVIWVLELISLIGLLIFLIRRNNPDFLPSKITVIFLMLVFLTLECGVRFADWRLFDYRGHIILGTSGRYFIPALASQLMLMAIGWGTFVKKESSFKIILKAGLALMVLLHCYSVLSIMIPRYYL